MNIDIPMPAKPSYELITPQENSSVLYREHGFPHPLVRWHFHKEYELHLITHSTGKVFVGDYIGNFYPGNLILTGPNLPHNWITQLDGNGVFPQRDRVVTFDDGLMQDARTAFPEMSALDNLLERARFGIEFRARETVKDAYGLIDRISRSEGLTRLIHFMDLMNRLAETQDYQLLSSNQSIPVSGERNLQRVNQAVNYIIDRYDRDLPLEEVADHLGMQPTYFSKFFRQATGRRFIEFVNSLRINRACDLLSRSDRPITDICFAVGFTNISNFNRHFFKLKEMTPSSYRKTCFVIAENWIEPPPH